MRKPVPSRTSPILAAVTAALVLLSACTPVQDTPQEGDAAPESAASPVDADAVTSAELIDAGLEAGEIDGPTATLYRTWASFHADRLPEEFRGYPAPHDLGFLGELADSLDTLPAETAAQIEPYLARPSEPGSAFTAEDGPVTQTVSAGASANSQECQAGWSTRAQQGPAPQFRAWVCNDVGGSDEVEAALEAVLAEVDTYAPKITTAMGPLISDEPGADSGAASAQADDDLIDIYVLPPGFLAPHRDHNARRMDENATGITMRAAPRQGNAFSAYVLLSSELLEYPDSLAYTVVHELTHVAQFARNWELIVTSPWVYEATAAWAEHHFAPDITAGINNRMKAMQTSPLAVHSNEGFHPYWAATWMLYMEQESGPESIFNVWSDLETETGETAVIDAIAAQLGDLEDHAPTFALRLLNGDFPGDPVPTRFAEVDPRLDDGLTPDVPPVDLADSSVTVDFDDVPGLGYRYAHVQLPPGDPEPRTITVSGDFPPEPAADVQVVLSGGESYRVRELPATGGELCAGGQELWVVLTNPSTDEQERISGSLTLDPPGTQCAAAESSPSPSGTPGAGSDPSETPGQSPAPSPDPEEETPAATPGEFCADLEAFSLRVGGIADLAMLPFTSGEVEEIFAHIDPYVRDLPDGTPEQVEVLRTAARAAADQPAAQAADILDDPAVRQASTAMNHLYGMMCTG